MNDIDIYDDNAQMKLYPVTINPNYYAVMQNKFVKANHGISSVKIGKFLRLMISQVIKNDKDLKTYTISITELADFWEIHQNNIYRDIEDMCEKLIKTTIKLKKGFGEKSKWSVFHWVSRADYEDGKVTFRFSDDVKPYILGLEEWYTQYKIQEIQGFRSYYTLRLYELIRCDYGAEQNNQGYIDYTIQQLREYFECVGKYKTTSLFLMRTIEPALEEINEQTSMDLETEYIRAETRGVPIIAVRFYVHIYESMEAKIDKHEYYALVKIYMEERKSGKTDLSYVEWREAKQDSQNIKNKAVL